MGPLSQEKDWEEEIGTFKEEELLQVIVYCRGATFELLRPSSKKNFEEMMKRRKLKIEATRDDLTKHLIRLGLDEAYTTTLAFNIIDVAEKVLASKYGLTREEIYNKVGHYDYTHSFCRDCEHSPGLKEGYNINTGTFKCIVHGEELGTLPPLPETRKDCRILSVSSEYSLT